MTTVVLLLAAGAGRRLGWAIPKAFVPLGGRLMVAYSLSSIARAGVADGVVLVAPESECPRIQTLLPELEGGSIVETVVAGGITRQESVRRGLESTGTEASLVVCHDAARPFASPELFRRVVDAVANAEGAIPVLPATDTVKRVRDEIVIETIPREEIFLTQTPQAFVASALRGAHDRAVTEGLRATDDAMLLEHAGFRVKVVPGEASNLKITSPEDLARAEELLASQRAAGTNRGRPGEAVGGD